MQQLTGQEIFYNADWFAEETLAKILAPDFDPTAGVGPAPPLPDSDPNPDQSKLYQQAWDQMLKNPDLASAIQKSDKTVDQSCRDWQSSKALEPMAPIGEFTVDVAADGSFVHKFNNQEILKLSASVSDAQKKSTRFQLIMAGARVVGDGIILILAGIGVKLALSPTTTYRVIVTEMVDYAAVGQQPIAYVIEEGQEIAATANMLEKIRRLAILLQQLPNLGEIAVKLLSQMTVLEIALTVAGLLAGIALLVASAGVKLALNLLALAFAGYVLGKDIEGLIATYNSYKAKAAAA